jgi:hypothetical protein
MAIYHLSMKSISRGNGRSATGAAAYRAGEEIADVRTGIVHDYSRKRGVEHTEGILPGGGGFNREDFWNRIEVHHKRGDAVLAREIEVSLPAELSRDARRALAAGFAREISDRYRVAADVSIHAPGLDRDQRNHHAHILLSACHVAEDGTPGKKAVELDPIHCDRHGLKNLADRERTRWAELCNHSLERAGVSVRVDHRSLSARGIDLAAGVHLGPNVVRMERRGLRTDRGDAGREIEKHNEEVRGISAKLIDLAEARKRIETEQRRQEENVRKREQKPAIDLWHKRWIEREQERVREREREKMERGNRPETLSEMVERMEEEARAAYRLELIRRGEWEPFGCRDERKAAEAAREKAREQWVREQDERENTAIMAAREGKKVTRMAEHEALERKLTILPRERQALVEQCVPAVLDAVKENLDRIKAQYDVLVQTIEAHMKAKSVEPEEPEPPEKPLSLFNCALWPPSGKKYNKGLDQYEKDMEAYNAARAACEQWKTTLDTYVKERDELRSSMDASADVLEHPNSKDPFKGQYESNVDWLLEQAARRARASNPERWEKLDQDIGSAKDWNKLATQNGCYHVIGDLPEAERILIAEGYATAVAVYEATGRPVVVAMDAGNLIHVARALREAFPKTNIMILGDDDRHLQNREPPLPNFGREKAEEAAREVGGDAIFPVFSESESGAEFTDFGDLARSRGMETVKRQVEFEIELQLKRPERGKSREREVDLQMESEEIEEDRGYEIGF